MFRGCVAWRVQGFRGFGFVARLQFFLSWVPGVLSGFCCFKLGA